MLLAMSNLSLFVHSVYNVCATMLLVFLQAC